MILQRACLCHARASCPQAYLWTTKPKKKPPKPQLVPFLLELAVYTVFVSLYLVLALHFLSGWLKHLSDEHRWGYASAGLGLMIVQAVVLEQLTVRLLRAFGTRKP